MSWVRIYICTLHAPITVMRSVAHAVPLIPLRQAAFQDSPIPYLPPDPAGGSAPHRNVKRWIRAVARIPPPQHDGSQIERNTYPECQPVNTPPPDVVVGK